MRRKIYDKLLEWQKSHRGDTALLIEGARRIGKSYIVEEFARKEYDSYILVDFSKVNPLVMAFFSLCTLLLCPFKTRGQCFPLPVKLQAYESLLSDTATAPNRGKRCRCGK